MCDTCFCLKRRSLPAYKLWDGRSFPIDPADPTTRQNCMKKEVLEQMMVSTEQDMKIVWRHLQHLLVVISIVFIHFEMHCLIKEF